MRRRYKTAEAIHKADQEIEKFQSVPRADVKKLRSFPTKFKEGKSILCFCCSGRGHLASTCRFRSAKCYRCGKVGHVARACSSKQHKEDNVNKMNEGDEDVDEDIVNKVTISETGVIWVKPCINDKNINMQLDTGSSLTIMSYADFVKYFGNKQLCDSNVVRKTYSGEKLKSLGYALVKVRLKDKVYELKLIVVDVHAPPLMGRDWLGATCDREELLNVFNMRSSYDDSVVNRLLKDYNDVFDGSLGTLTKITGKLYLKELLNLYFVRHVHFLTP